VFQKDLTEAKEPPPKPEEKPFPEGTYTRDFCQTDTTLFRMSAITFNAHKIHVNKEWCRNVEGHRDLVVHGPLNLINILDLYRDVNERGSSETIPKSITYRATAPLYVGEKYRIILEKESNGGGGERPKWKADIYDSFGRVAVKASIVE
jgi:hydroxyacyl-ACP dehydratase HTD2-like protein with hotdog domain